MSRPDYTKKAIESRVNKRVTAITEKRPLRGGESEEIEAIVREEIKAELTASIKDRTGLVQDAVKQYFRDRGLSHPLGNKLIGYIENRNLEEFIGGGIVPPELVIGVLSANGGQSSLPPPHTVINADENANSIILQVIDKATGHSILLPGDATGVTTDRVLSRFPPALREKIQYVVASHHGSDTDETNNREWIEVIKPGFVLFSASMQGNNYNHPRCSSVTHYLKYAAPDPPHKLTCFAKRNERIPDVAFGPSRVSREFLDKDDDMITIEGVAKRVYYSGDANYQERLPFP